MPSRNAASRWRRATRGAGRGPEAGGEHPTDGAGGGRRERQQAPAALGEHHEQRGGDSGGSPKASRKHADRGARAVPREAVCHGSTVPRTRAGDRAARSRGRCRRRSRGSDPPRRRSTSPASTSSASTRAAIAARSPRREGRSAARRRAPPRARSRPRRPARRPPPRRRACRSARSCGWSRRGGPSSRTRTTSPPREETTPPAPAPATQARTASRRRRPGSSGLAARTIAYQPRPRAAWLARCSRTPSASHPAEAPRQRVRHRAHPLHSTASTRTGVRPAVPNTFSPDTVSIGRARTVPDPFLARS